MNRFRMTAADKLRVYLIITLGILLGVTSVARILLDMQHVIQIY